MSDDQAVDQELQRSGTTCAGTVRTGAGHALPIRPTLVLVGPKDARRRVRPILTAMGAGRPVEAAVWRDLPPGPAVCVDARRFEYLSPGALDVLADAVSDGSVIVVPASNAGPWPMCGFDPPRGAVRRRDLDAHSVHLVRTHGSRVPGESLGGVRIAAGWPLPPVFAVADASLIVGTPTFVGDLHALAHDAVLAATVWCHQRDRVLLSAAMIVKDEAHNMEAALESVRGLVDEVVVYDTGSTDDTVAVARAAGAVVRQGYWDDDFSRARNESFRMARGEWILLLDADDRLIADRHAIVRLRRLLGEVTVRRPVQFRTYNIVNHLTGQLDSGFWSRRVFPAEMRWRNRVHECAVMPDGGLPGEVLSFADVIIRHEGYGGDMTGRTARNLRLARKRVEDGGDSATEAMDLFELGRAAVGARDLVAAREALARSIELARPGSVEDNCSRLFLVGLLREERAPIEEIDVVLAPVLACGGAAEAAARWVRAGVVDDPREALATLDGVDRVEYMFANASADAVAALRAFLLAASGDRRAALEVVRTMESPTLQQHAWWAAARAVADESAGDPAGDPVGDPVGDAAGDATLDTAGDTAGDAAGDTDDSGEQLVSLLADRLDVGDLSKAVIALTSGPVSGVHEVATRLLDRFGAVPALVAYLASGSPRSGFVPALDARVRLQALGALAEGDPLDVLVHTELAPPADRMLAALVLDEVEPQHPARVHAVAAQVADEAVAPVLAVVESIVPDLLSEAASALATTPERSTAVLRVFDLLDA